MPAWMNYELRRERERADLLEILPSYDTKRWVASRKAAVVIAVREGVISRGIACDWYQLSSEELASWELAFKRSGTTGLRASYRFPEMRASAPPPVGFDRNRGLSDRISLES